jgi:large subunit ribosomal protein L2
VQPTSGSRRAAVHSTRPTIASSSLAGATAPDGKQSSLPFLAAAAASAAVLLRARVICYGKKKGSGRPVATSGIYVRKPMNNSLRNQSIPTFEEITTWARYEPLVYKSWMKLATPLGRPKSCGMAVGRRMGGHNVGRDPRRQKMYRIIDFARSKRGIYGTITSIEYDPFRKARISLVEYEDGEKRYILAAMGFFVGQQVIASEDAPVFVGNAMPLNNVPVGTLVHNIEAKRRFGGAIARAAGTSAVVLSKDDRYVTLKLPSSEVRMYPKALWCTIGKVSNPVANLIKLGKASNGRKQGFRPHIRGSARNCNEHPNGGGEGRSPIGAKYPRTKFGKCVFKKTRSYKRKNSKFVLIRKKNRSELGMIKNLS